MLYTMRCIILTCAQKLANSQLNLPHGTKQKRVMKKLKTETEMLRRNGPVIKSVESVLRPEWSLWRERFAKEVGFEPGVKEWGSSGWREWRVDRLRQKRPQQSAIPNCPTAGHGSKYQRVLGDRRPVELYTPTDRQSFGQILLIVSSKAPRQLYTRRRVTTASADKSTDRSTPNLHS